MLKDNLKNVSYGFIIIPIVLSIIGLMFVYSTGIRAEDGTIGPLLQSQFFKQLVWFMIGIGISIFILSVDYFQLADIGEYFYIAGILLLIITLVFGKDVRGAKSWLGIGGLGIQPSEIMKLFYILFYAKYLSRAPLNEKKVQTFLISLAILVLPLGLIMLQPDLGTSIVFLVIFMFMSYMGMSDNTYINYVLIIGISTIILVLGKSYYQFYYLEQGGHTLMFWEGLFSATTLGIITLFMFLSTTVLLIISFFNPVKIIAKIVPYLIMIGSSSLISAVAFKVLKPYQWKRLLAFVSPELDRWGAGYNIIQSMIAIGSGQFRGKGLFRGSQNTLGFLPEKSTDFIFSIISEELGFLGGSLVIGLFVMYFYYINKTIQNAKDKEGMLVASGTFAMFFIHFIINVGMTLGWAPVTGLPLPFISYGGSSYLTFIIGAALISNIYSHRFVH